MAQAPWQAVAILVDPVRRELYHYVRHQDHLVNREEAADAIGISRGLAAFHLDKLVEAGLLVARYQARDDQPRGRGRTPKVYELAADGLSLAIPERRYDLIGAILADAVEQESALRHARSRGRLLGAQRQGGALDGVAEALAELGFEPDRVNAETVILRNCPFHALAMDNPELVCGLNHALIEGLIEGMRPGDVEAALAPRPGACCVQLRGKRVASGR